jgi:hypothetical protein
MSSKGKARTRRARRRAAPRKTCAGTTRAGNPCRSWVKKGEDYCGRHLEANQREPHWVGRFIETLSNTGNVRVACQAASVDRSEVYRRRGFDQPFRDRWETALDQYVEVLEAELHRRAVQGVEKKKSHFYKGKLVGTDTVREFSDVLLIFRLKALRPDVYRDRYEVTHKTDDDVDAEIKRLDAELTRLAAGAPVPKE